MENYTIAKYLLTVMPDVCTANGKDPAATELLEKLKKYGEVVPFEKVEATLRAEYQATIDNLTKQLRAIQNQELTEDEIIFLNFYRARKVANAEVYQRKIDAQAAALDEVRIASQKRAAQITELAAQLAELSAN